MQLDFFMVTETWLFDSFADNELFFPNYSLYRSERKAFENVSKHGGVLIAVRNDITSEEIYLAKSVLGATVACEIDSDGHKILLMCFYNPPFCPANTIDYRLPSQTVLDIFNEVFDISKRYNEVLICGDFNITDADWQDYATRSTETQDLLRHI